uniref:Uncharacterized protein n=1 Tax=viral metagenome TaxID=1070528 RepID=A0A6C0ED33_9ZZZZ
MKGTFSYEKGCLFINIIDASDLEKYLDKCPEACRKLQQDRDNGKYHLTVCIPSELKTTDIKFDSVEVDVLIYGFSQNDGCYYLVCGCSEADNLRKQYKLESKDYHITIGYEGHDNHSLSKNIRSITLEDENIIENVISVIKKSHDHNKNLDTAKQLFERHSDNADVVYTYVRCLINSKDYETAMNLADSLVILSPIKGYLVQFKLKKYLNLLNNTFVDSITENLLRETKVEQSKDLDSLLSFINEFIISNNLDKTKSLLTLENNKIETIETPINFSKVDDKLYGSGLIKYKHMNVLRLFGITQIINLIGEEKPHEDYIKFAKTNNINVHYFPIDDFRDTDIDVIDKILDILKDNHTVVHCRAGVGRTNMVLACYLIKYLGKSPSEAVTILENNRKVHLSLPQMLLIKDYYKKCNSSSQQEHFSKYGMVMLMGLPLSGKSTLAQDFLNKYLNVVHINQDELGKKDCEKLFVQKAKHSPIILDLCNLTKNHRKEWIMSYKDTASKKICGIFFNLDIGVCLERAKHRQDHPTLKAHSAPKILEEMSKVVELPVLSEGFDELFIVHDQDELSKLKMKLNLADDIDIDTLIKFPRTKHLINLGSATRDDLLFDKDELHDFLKHELSIEEKVDGANLGLFRNSENKIMAQNRSHFVNSAYHEQFKSLDNWIESKSIELHNIFEKGNYVLYGEWLYMKHSINYDALPDYFLLFDVYDRNIKEFLSRNKIAELIDGSSLKLIPVLYQGKLSLEELKKMVNHKSNFYDGKVEGIYVKVFDGDIVKLRGKVVRSDFLGNDEESEHVEHWTKGKYIHNKISYE